MKKLLFVFLVSAMGLAQAYAQPQRMSPEERLKMEMDRLKEALTLDSKQVDKITPIVKESQEKQAEMFRKMRDSGQQPDREKMREERQKMQTELDKKIGEFLTKEQIEKLKVYREEQVKRMQERMQNRQ